MKKIEDLSYSNLVNIIQNDTKEAAKVLTQLALEHEAIKDEIEAASRKWHGLKDRERSLIEASHNVLRHINKRPELIIKRPKFIIKVTESTLLVDRNVI